MDLKTYLSNERLHKVNTHWQYLKPWHRARLCLNAWWWSLPTIVEVIERIRERVDVWVTYRIYKAHWL